MKKTLRKIAIVVLDQVAYRLEQIVYKIDGNRHHLEERQHHKRMQIRDNAKISTSRWYDKIEGKN